MNYFSLHTVLRFILSTLGCDFCIPTTVSVLIPEWWKEDRTVESVLKKRHYLLKVHSRKRGELSFPQRFTLIFRSRWLRRSHAGQRTWGHLSCSFSAPSFIGAVGSFNSGHRWGCMNVAISSMLCALLLIFSLQVVHFIYTLYMICLVYCKCMIELHECISFKYKVVKDSCTSFCIGKIHGAIYCRHWLLFEHSR